MRTPLEEFWRGGFEPAINRTGRETSVVKAKVSPTVAEIHRAAAWWAGEGSVVGKSGRLSVTVAQKEMAVLRWLVERFGGSISMRRRAGQPHLAPVHAWHIHGPRARGFLMTIYSCIPESPRRQEQMRKALAATSEIRKRGPQPESLCGKGHWKELGEECRVCANQELRKRRAATPAGEQHRRKEFERYWRNPEKYRVLARKYRETRKAAT
jgi:hypothetical protein